MYPVGGQEENEIRVTTGGRHEKRNKRAFTTINSKKHGKGNLLKTQRKKNTAIWPWEGGKTQSRDTKRDKKKQAITEKKKGGDGEGKKQHRRHVGRERKT